jgi:hypothetical protein
MTCKLSSDAFCYVCGYFITNNQPKHSIVAETKFFKAYEAYFGFPVSNQSKPWAHHVSCSTCRSTLEGWLRGVRKTMLFAIPRIWRGMQLVSG